MNVNFTGMQNVGAIKKRNREDHQERVLRMSIQLNNKDESDLDDFKKVLEKRPDAKNNGFLNIELKSTPNKRNPDKPTNDLYINSKKLELNDENLPVFTKINNLLKRIIKGEENIPLFGPYLLKEAPIRYSSELRAFKSQAQLAALSDIHNPSNVRADAGIMSDEIVKTLTNYCTEAPKSIFQGVKNIGGFSFKTQDKCFDRLSFELDDKDKRLFNPYLERDIFGTSSNVINIDLVKTLKTGATKLTINDTPLVINAATLPVLKKTTAFLSEIVKTKDELPFPADYLSPKSLNKLSKDAFVDGELKDYLEMSEQSKREQGFEFDVEIMSTDKDIKQATTNILSSVDEKILKFFD